MARQWVRWGCGAVLVAVVASLGLTPWPSASPSPASAVSVPTAVVPCSRGSVVLTFDDGPHGTFTPAMLDVLRRERVRATFFQVGWRVATYPALTRRAHAAGHRVGNHTWAHENLTTLSDDAIRQTLARTNAAVRDAGVPRPTVMRPPYGATSARVSAVARSLDLAPVLWTVDPQDWTTGRSADTIRRLVLSALHANAVVLLHDGVANSGSTVAAVPGIVRGARALGFCFGTLGPGGAVRPPRPAARVHGARAVEPDAGQVVRVPVRVTLSEPTSRPVSVGYLTRDGSAVAGRDYVATSGRVRIGVGSTSAVIPVLVRGDARDEAYRERFTVRLRAPDGVSIARRVASVTIVDDDPKPSVAVQPVTVVEGAAGTTTTVAVPVLLSARSWRTVTVRYVTEPRTAAAGSDYRASEGTLRLSPGSLRGLVRLTVFGDDVDELDETFVLRLTSATNAAISRATATVTVQDDDEPPPPPGEPPVEPTASPEVLPSVDGDVDVVVVVGGR
jgi:peptidoglycan/xylan/chitin deacetylase (PgdA/CDA1 family)